MALHLNLLHEEIREQRQRQRDPLKIGVMVLIALGTILFLYYMFSAYRTLEIKTRLSSVERDWSKVEPQVTAAQKRSAELNDIIKTTKVLEDYIDKRFFWGPFLQKVARCVAPNTQLTSVDGTVQDEYKGVTVSIEGTAAGREPRAAAEDLRQLLVEQLGKDYSDVKIEFKTLEDLDTIVNVSGTNMAMAHYILNVSFNPYSGAKAPGAPTTERAAKQR
jgi:Tfp pilus assembly protein PilN